MADVHRRAAASSPRLSPEEITNRGFASAFRGISETEVRNFLRRVADEIVATRAREAALEGQIEELQEQIRNPTPVTEQQLLSSLGEETARVLRSAQEAAEEIRKRAEERAATLVREAQEESTRLRESAQQYEVTRKEAADQKASELEQEAEAQATRVREEAERDANAARESTAREVDEIREAATTTAAEEIATAQAKSFTLVDEARTVRERVLADLGRRRSLLQAQVDELRSGRDRLLDAYRVVKRTLSDATDALGHVEARANAELAAPPARVTVPPVEGELEILESATDAGSRPARSTTATEETSADGPEGEGKRGGEEESVVVIVDGAVDSPAAKTNDTANGRSGATPDAEDSGAAVDALFARLRSHTVDPGPGATLPAPAPGPEAGGDTPETTAAPAPTAAAKAADTPEAADPAQPETEAEAPASTTEGKAESTTENEDEKAADGRGGAGASDAPPAEPLAPDDQLRADRAAILEPLARDLTRRAKRALQDQQNELLDRIRTIKGKVEAAQVLPEAAEQEAAWVPVLDEPLRAAYARAYSELADGGVPPSSTVPRELLEELAHTMVEPWRQRLVTAIDGAAEDPDAVTQRLGARYREYRGRELEDALGDALAAAWARGAFAAVPDGTLLRWIPAEVGRCPDCDDNALEPTARNSPFPTGQLFPPAHPGCRCFLAHAQPAPAKS